MERISALNRIPVVLLRNTLSPYTPNSLWIEDGKIKGTVSETTGKLHKEIPTQTANPSGD